MAENSGNHRRGNGRPFRAGQSGNPGGRPKEYPGFREWAKGLIEERGGQAEIEWMALQRENLKAKGFALRLAAEYAYGRPPQDLNVTGEIHHIARVIDEYPDGRRVVREVERQTGAIPGITQSVH